MFESLRLHSFRNKVEVLLPKSRQQVAIFGAPLLYLLIVSISIFLLFSHWGYDDPYITYRYVENLSHGRGFVYNPGERILSTTTPFFTLLLTILSPLNLDLPRLANLIGAFSLAIGGLFLWDLAQTWKTPAVGWAGILLYPIFPLLISTLGSETPLYLAFCIGSFAAYARQRYNWTAAFTALALLTRPDGVLVPVLLAADFLWRVRRPIPWKAVLLFLGLTLPWFLFAWIYFGYPLPVTLAAKQNQGLMATSQRFPQGFLSLVRQYSWSWQYWVEAGLSLLGFVFMAWRAKRWVLFLSWTALYFVAYSLLGVSRYYWYYAPLVPGFVVLVGLGIEAVFRFVKARTGEQPHKWRNLPVAVVLAILAPVTIAQGSELGLLRQRNDSRVEVYRVVADWLKNNTTPDATVGTLEVGIIGYYSQRLMLDFSGLIQPEIGAQMNVDTNYQEVALWATEHYQPKYLILQKGDFPNIEWTYAAKNCEIVKRFNSASYAHTDTIIIYDCR